MQFTTLELRKKNSRIRESMNEIMLMSKELVSGLVSDLCDRVGAIHKAAEAVALTDMVRRKS